MISLKTIRRTGIFGLRTCNRCQAIASPSRSSSVASRSSSASRNLSPSSFTRARLSAFTTQMREVAVDVHAQTRHGCDLYFAGMSAALIRKVADVANFTGSHLEAFSGNPGSSWPSQATRRSPNGAMRCFQACSLPRPMMRARIGAVRHRGVIALASGGTALSPAQALAPQLVSPTGHKMLRSWEDAPACLPTSQLTRSRPRRSVTDSG